MKKAITFGFGIPAHNEAQTIGPLLEHLRAIKWAGRTPEKIVVVSEGSTDETNAVVKDLVSKSKEVPIILKIFSERRGKPIAINEMVKELKGLDVIGMISADCSPAAGTIEQLLEAFQDPTVGISAGRVVTCGPEDNLAVSISKILWDVHHEIALDHPKSTEITFFRNIPLAVHPTTKADEADLEASLLENGYKISYNPTAIIYNQAPLALSDYFKQRVRVTVGHLDVTKRTGYNVGTMKMGSRVDAIKKVIRRGDHRLTTLALGTFLETVIYLCARFKMLCASKDNSGIWSQSATTKRPF